MKVNDKRKRRRKILDLFTVTIVIVVVSVLTTLTHYFMAALVIKVVTKATIIG